MSKQTTGHEAFPAGVGRPARGRGQVVRRVLVCDDEATSRYLITHVLTRHLGCEVEQCADGLDALARIENEPFDLVVLDLQIPTISGPDVLRAVRQSPARASLPVVIISSEQRADIVRDLVHLGISGYIVKPMRFAKVQETLQKAVYELGAPALLIDGDAAYRRSFVERRGVSGSITEAQSGTDGLAKFKAAPVPVVYVGDRLGVISRKILAATLRSFVPAGQVRIVGLVDAVGDAGEDLDAFDEVMPRALTSSST